MLIALVTTLALAQDCPAPDRNTLDALAHLSAQAVESDAVMMHESAMEQFTSQAKCLRVPVPVEPWAAILVSEAIIRQHHGQDPTIPLATAMKIDPATWVPPELLQNGVPRLPEPAPDAPEVPADTMMWVDGVVVTGRIPDVSGLHIVQMQRMTEFGTAVGKLPFEVAAAPPPRRGPGIDKLEKGGGKKMREPREGGGSALSGDDYDMVVAHAALVFGVAGAGQRPSQEREFITDESVGGLSIGVAGQALVAIPDVPLRGWAALHGSPGRSGGLEVAAGAGMALGDVIVYGGIGASGVRLVEGDASRKPLLGHPRVGARYSTTLLPGFDANVQLGVMPASSFLSASAGYAPVDFDFGQVRFGGEFTHTTGRFVQPDVDWRDVGAGRWRVGATVGASWGHMREAR